MGGARQMTAAVIYARYSSDNQREESIEGQILVNVRFMPKRTVNITVIKHYIDRVRISSAVRQALTSGVLADGSAM